MNWYTELKSQQNIREAKISPWVKALPLTGLLALPFLQNKKDQLPPTPQKPVSKMVAPKIQHEAPAPEQSKPAQHKPQIQHAEKPKEVNAPKTKQPSDHLSQFEMYSKQHPSNNPNISRDYLKIVAFADQQGFHVTSTIGDKHNVGSDHYKGKAINVRVRDKTKEQIANFIMLAKQKGFRVRDETQKPPGQKVWSGAHLHLSVP